MKLIISLLLIISFGFGKDEKRMDLIDIPFKEASMLQGYSQVRGVDIHARVINEEEQESYFDEELVADGVYPVLTRITNNSKTKVLIYAIGSTLNNNLRSIPLQQIIEPYQKKVALKGALFGAVGNVISFGMRVASGADDKESAEAQAYIEEIRNEFYKKTLKQTLLYPGDTISGFVFFDNQKIKKENKLTMKIQFMKSIRKYNLETKVFQ